MAEDKKLATALNIMGQVKRWFLKSSVGTIPIESHLSSKTVEEQRKAVKLLGDAIKKLQEPMDNPTLISQIYSVGSYLVSALNVQIEGLEILNPREANNKGAHRAPSTGSLTHVVVTKNDVFSASKEIVESLEEIRLRLQDPQVV